MIRVTYNSEFFAHSGVKGMHWGHRRYQYEDMSLTPEGRVHYGVGEPRGKGSSRKTSSKKSSSPEDKKGLSEGQKKALKIGAAVAGTALLAYGGYKLSGSIRSQSIGKKQVESILNNVERIPINNIQVNNIPVNKTTVTKTVVNTSNTAKTAVKTAASTASKASSGINLTLNPGTTVNMKDIMASASKMSAASAKSAVSNSGVEDYTMELLKKVSSMH